MKMTLHRALAMRKTTKERIKTELATARFIEVAIGTADAVNGVPIEQIKKKIRSSYDKITALIDNLEALNRAISRANAGVTDTSSITEAEIGDKKYILADLIQLTEVIGFKRSFLAAMSSGNSKAIVKVGLTAEAVAKRCDEFLAGMAGGDKSKLTKEDIDNYTKSFHENNDARLIDPLGLQTLIPKMEKEIADFATEVDSKISELNALTQIEVEIKD